MKKLNILTAALCLFCFSAVAQPIYQWAKNLTTGINESQGLACDNSGNVYITGYFHNTVDFDPGAGTANLSSLGLQDIYFAKYDASGNYVWAKTVGGSTGDDISYKIMVDANGNLLICGSFTGTVDFDPGPGIVNLSNAGTKDAFFAKYDNAGNILWAKKIGGAGLEEILAAGIDGNGNIYTTGYFNGVSDFDPGAGTQNLASNGGEDIFYAKYDASGNYTWAFNVGSGGNDRANDIAVDNSSNCIIGGKLGSGSADFDPGAGTANRTGQMFYAQYNSSGVFVLAQAMGTLAFDKCKAVDTDNSGNIYIAGEFNSTIDFDPSPSVYNVTAPYNDLYFAKYDAAGTFIYAKKIESGNSDYMFDLHVNRSNGDTYISTEFGATNDVDPGPGVYNVASFYHAMFAKYDLFGNFGWGFAIGVGGGPDEDHGYGIIEKNGSVYLCGGFKGGTCDADPGPGTANITSGANQSSFFGKYGDCVGLPTQPGAISGPVTICQGTTNTYSVTAVAGASSYTWTLPGGWSGTSVTNSINATASATSGNVTVTANNACGSSNPQTLSVTVNPIYTSNTTAAICQGDSILLAGAYKKIAGNYSDILQSINGCDSAVITALTVNPLPTVTLSNQNAVCMNAPAFTLSGGAPVGGTYSGVGVNNNQFDPAVAGAGTHTITYSYTDGNTGCSNSTTTTIVVNPLPTVSLGTFTAVCTDAAAFALTGGLPAGGAYSGVGVNNNQFDAAVAGAGTHTISYTYTDGNTGCSNSGTNTIVVNPLPPTPIITVNGTTFTSSAANGNQWYLNGNPINGATNQTFVCTVNGNYTVCVTDANGCKSCSAVLNFTTFAISEQQLADNIIVYPNPFSGEVTLRLSKGSGQAVLYNTLGKTVYSTQLTSQPLTIYLNEVPTGIYFLQVKNDTGTVTKKIIKN